MKSQRNLYKKREVRVGEVKELLTEVVKSCKEEREQEKKVDMKEIIRQQQQEHNKDMKK